MIPAEATPTNMNVKSDERTRMLISEGELVVRRQDQGKRKQWGPGVRSSERIMYPFTRHARIRIGINE